MNVEISFIDMLIDMWPLLVFSILAFLALDLICVHIYHNRRMKDYRDPIERLYDNED